jgi:hypothetical protein
MITIRPTFWRPLKVFWAVVIGGFCLSPVVFQGGTSPELMGLGVLAFSTVFLWLAIRPTRLEITQTEVRAVHGWEHAPPGKQEAYRSEIRSIHYRPDQISFRGADSQSVLEANNLWSVGDMVKAAEKLRVPLYDDRVEGLLKVRELSEGRLVYDPVSGPVTAISRKHRQRKHR